VLLHAKGEILGQVEAPDVALAKAAAAVQFELDEIQRTRIMVQELGWSSHRARRRPYGSAQGAHGVRLNDHLEHPEGAVVFQHACKMGLEGIVSKRLGSRYRSGRSPDWLKFKNPDAPAVKREAEEDWAK
jgi:hypothetical protein